MFIPQISLKEQYKSLKTEVDKEVLQVLENGNYILGENVKKCEEEISVYVGAKFGIGVNSGQMRLLLH